MKRAGFIKNHLHVTKFGRKQMFAAGTYPNQSRGGDSLEHLVKKNRSIQSEDIVVWYNMGVHHVVRPDDCPVMPTHYIGFKSYGFFDGNPELDLPRPDKGASCYNNSCHSK